eukprot:jgi/Mesvir1/1697/Mv21157-RA.1
MAATDLASLRAYVMGPSSQNKLDCTVLLHVTHSNLKARFMELRFDLHTTILGMKEKLHTHTGTAVASMQLQLKDVNGGLVAHMMDESSKLGFYSPADGYTVHVVDTDPLSASANGWLEDTSLVEKYVMSDEDYNKREVTYRKYLQKMRESDPKYDKNEAAKDPEYLADAAAAIQVGQRCEVTPGGNRGEVMFVGKCDKLGHGYWVGIKFDEPVGKNDGSVNGVRFFECPPRYGGLLRPDRVKVGDFPERDPFEEEEDEI